MSTLEVVVVNLVCDTKHSGCRVLSIRHGVPQIVSTLRRPPDWELPNQFRLSYISETKVKSKYWGQELAGRNELSQNQRAKPDEQGYGRCVVAKRCPIRKLESAGSHDNSILQVSRRRDLAQHAGIWLGLRVWKSRASSKSFGYRVRLPTSKRHKHQRSHPVVLLQGQKQLQEDNISQNKADQPLQMQVPISIRHESFDPRLLKESELGWIHYYGVDFQSWLIYGPTEVAEILLEHLLHPK